MTNLEAFATAKRKARFDHREQLVWANRSGEFFTERCTAAAVKKALLANGTRRKWWIIGSDGVSSIGFWAMGIIMIRNARHFA